MANTYSTGAVNVVHGSTTVTLDGGVAVASTIKAGDLIVVNNDAATANSIASLTSATVLELVLPYTGATANGRKYIVTHMPMGWGGRVELLEGVAEEIRLINGGVITAVTYSTRAQLYADLKYKADALGKVLDDPNDNYDGVYKKVGDFGAGSWVRVGPLPERAELNAYLIGQTAAIAANAAAIIEIRNEMQDF